MALSAFSAMLARIATTRRELYRWTAIPAQLNYDRVHWWGVFELADGLLRYGHPWRGSEAEPFVNALLWDLRSKAIEAQRAIDALTLAQLGDGDPPPTWRTGYADLASYLGKG